MKLRRLTLNVVLPGAGTVIVSEPVVVESLNSPGQSAPSQGHVPAAWSTYLEFRLLSVCWFFLATVLACLAGVAAMLNKPVLTPTLCGAGWAFSGAAMALGLCALLDGQPAYVTFPMLLAGFIYASIFLFNLRFLARRAQTEELRRMIAADVV